MSESVWTPTPKQQLALQTTAKYILFAGSRGGGKTDASLMQVFINNNHMNPEFRVLVLRKNTQDLSDYIARAWRIYQKFGAKKSGALPVFKFPSGATIVTGHLASPDAFEHYQGQEFQLILIEELTHIASKTLFEKILGSLRSTIDGIGTRLFATTNPGGPGHEWVKEFWKIGDHPCDKKFDDNGLSKIYIHANIDDNPHLFDADPEYVKYLDNLPEDLRQKWRFGSFEDFDTPAQFYALYLTKAKNAGRLTTIPIMPSLKTYVSFDLGMRDQMVIWMAQIHGKEVRIVHCYANRNLPLKHYVDYIDDMRNKHSFRVDKFFVPHDANVRSMTDDTSRFEKLQQLGCNVEMAPGVDVASGIDAVRDLLGHCYFDSDGCKDGLMALRQYHREFDQKANRYKDNPEHDWASDYADSFRYLALSLADNMVSYSKINVTAGNSVGWMGA